MPSENEGALGTLLFPVHQSLLGEGLGPICIMDDPQCHQRGSST